MLTGSGVAATDLAGGGRGNQRRTGTGVAATDLAAGGRGKQRCAGASASSLPVPPEFSPFSWPVDDGGMDVDELCSRIGVDCSPSLSPIGRVCSDVSDSTDSPGVGVLVSPLIDSSSDVAPVVDHATLPLPSVDNIFVQDMLWAPAAPQDPKLNDDREIPVPRWRLAREGPFLAEQSPESIRSLGAGCAFRNTTYHASDYATPLGDYGLPLHHPRFIEWIGVSQSAGLIEISGAQWVNKLSRDQAVAAAVHPQRGVGLMQTNVDVLEQYAPSLQKMASRMIELCLGSRVFPAEDVAAGALGPRVRRAAVQMEAMGLWRPSLDPLRLH